MALIAHWPLSTNIKDISGNGHDLTGTCDFSRDNNLCMRVCEMNGVNHALKSEIEVVKTKSYTIVADIRFTGSNSYRKCMIGAHGAIGVKNNSRSEDSKLCVVSWGNDEYTSRSIELHNWHRIICHFDIANNKKRMYIDNMLISESIYDTSKWLMDSGKRKICIGGYFDVLAGPVMEDFCAMRIKDVKIYDDINTNDFIDITKISHIGRRPYVHARLAGYEEAELVSGKAIQRTNAYFLENDLFPETTLGNITYTDIGRCVVNIDDRLKNQYFTNSTTVFWFYTDPRSIANTTSGKMLFDSYSTANNKAFRISLTAKNNVSVAACTGYSIQSKMSIEAKRWYHLAVVITKTSISLIINGNLDNKITFDAPAIPNHFCFGNAINLFSTDGGYASATNLYPFYGMYRDLKIYEHSLHLEQIRSEYNKYSLGKPKNDYTVAHWPFDGSLRNTINPSNPVKYTNPVTRTTDKIKFEYGSGPLGKCLYMADGRGILDYIYFGEWPESDYLIGYDKPISISMWHFKESVNDPVIPENGVISNFFRNCVSFPSEVNGLWIDSTKEGAIRIETPSGSHIGKPGTVVYDKWTHYYFYLHRTKGLEIYINGKLVDMIGFDSSSEFLSSSFKSFIGGYHTTCYTKVCDYKIYNRKLTEKELNDEMDCLLVEIGAEKRFERKLNLLPDLYRDGDCEQNTTSDPADWDPTLHRYALAPGYNWTNGVNAGVPNTTIGYHAVIYREGDDIYCTYRNLNSTINPSITKRWLGWAHGTSVSNLHGVQVKPSTYYTISFDMLSDTYNATITLGLHHNRVGNDAQGFWSGIAQLVPIQKINEWHRVHYTFKTTADIGTYYSIYIYGHEGDEGTVCIKNVSMVEDEKGSDSLIFEPFIEEKTKSLYNVGITTRNTPIINAEQNFMTFRNVYGYNSFIDIIGLKHPQFFTYAMWLRTNDSDAYTIAGVHMTTQTEGLALRNDGTLIYRSYRSVGSETTYDRMWCINSKKVNDGKWHHVAMTYDGTTLKIYVDGKLEGREDVDINFRYLYMQDPTRKFRLGSSEMTPEGKFYNRAFDGDIKNFKLYGRALHLSDILDLFYTFRSMKMLTNENIKLNTNTLNTIERKDDFMKLQNYEDQTNFKIKNIEKNSWIQYSKRSDVYTFYFFLEQSIIPNETVTIEFDVLPLKVAKPNPAENEDANIDIFFFDQKMYNTAIHTTISGFNEGEWKHVSVKFTNPRSYTLRLARTDVNYAGDVYYIKNFNIIHDTSIIRPKLIEYKYKRKYDCNLLSLNGWNKPKTGDIWNFKTLATNTDDPGKRIIIKNPWGELDTVWASVYNSATSDGDAGWNCTMDFNNQEILDSYVFRYSVWITMENLFSQANGQKIFFGCLNNSVEILNPNGTVNDNPYFAIDSYTNYPYRWVLIVSYVFPNTWNEGMINSFLSINKAGAYDTMGNKIGVCSVFKRAASTSAIRHRAYLYYSEDSRANIFFYKPRIDIIHMNEPSVYDICSGNDGGLVKDMTSPDDKYFIETKIDSDGTKWGKIIYHKPNGGNALVGTIQKFNRSDEPDFKSCFYILNSCRDEDDYFEFKLEYEGLPGFNRWKQQSNPLYSDKVQDYIPISISWENADGYPFTGLANPKDDYGNSFLCGSTGGGWWWSVGARVKYSSESSGIPGPYSGANFTSLSLWVKLIDKHVTIGKNKIIARDVIYE